MERNSRTAGTRPTARHAGVPAWLHVAALAIAALAGIVAFPLHSHAAPQPGTAAPDFALKDLNGANQRLSEFRGDIVLLTFWASWCGPCRETLAQLDDLDAAASGGPVVISVNVEGDTERARSVASSLGVGHAALIDERQAVGRLYDVSHLPLTLLLDRDGVIRGSWSREPVPAGELLANIRELQQL